MTMIVIIDVGFYLVHILVFICLNFELDAFRLSISIISKDFEVIQLNDSFEHIF